MGSIQEILESSQDHEAFTQYKNYDVGLDLEIELENLELQVVKNVKDLLKLRKKNPNTEFFWSVFSLLWTEYDEIRSISPYSVRMRENTNQKKLRIWALFAK